MVRRRVNGNIETHPRSTLSTLDVQKTESPSYVRGPHYLGRKPDARISSSGVCAGDMDALQMCWVASYDVVLVMFPHRGRRKLVARDVHHFHVSVLKLARVQGYGVLQIDSIRKRKAQGRRMRPYSQRQKCQVLQTYYPSRENEGYTRNRACVRLLNLRASKRRCGTFFQAGVTLRFSSRLPAPFTPAYTETTLAQTPGRKDYTGEIVVTAVGGWGEGGNNEFTTCFQTQWRVQ